MGLKRRVRGGGFESIYALAAARKGEAELEDELPQCLGADALAKIADARVLARMTQAVFSAGFVWRVVENKWPGFEDAFCQFAIAKNARLSPSDIDDLTRDTRVIRNRQKIESVRENARFIGEVAGQHGSFGRYLAAWPEEDTIGLWSDLHKRGSRLGGFTGPMVLRHLGKDTFMITRDVGLGLIREGVVGKHPTSKRDLALVQVAFNRWRAETGRPLGQLSKILACSVE